MRNIQTITKWLMGAALASAFVLAVPHQAQAQVSFGVEAGYAPQAYGYYGPNQRREYFERERFEAERAARWRHEAWEREHFRDHDGWRDRDRFRDHRFDRDDRR